MAFKMMKYSPTFPDRFGSIEHDRACCREFFDWFNTQHRHSGIAMMTPEQVHYGSAALVAERRSKVLAAAFNAHPERFVHIHRPERARCVLAPVLSTMDTLEPGTYDALATLRGFAPPVARATTFDVVLF